jgi:uncharacterized membrane protein
MKKWQLELVVFIILMFIVFLVTSGTGGYEAGAALTLPVVIITWIIGEISDKLHPKYVCKICGFKSASEEKMRDHILEVHSKEEIRKAAGRAIPERQTEHFAASDKKNLHSIDKFEKKNRNYGLVQAIILGLVLFGALAYVLSILGVIIYFVAFYLLERHYERRNRFMYYTAYYALRVGAVMVVIAVILFFLLSLGIFRGTALPST